MTPTTITERAREQAAKFVEKNIDKFSEHPELWIEAITLELLQFQFNEFKLEVTTSHVSQQDIDNELAKYL
jgi:hypothetical protein